MPSPPFPVAVAGINALQFPACVRLELVHNSFRARLRLHDYVHMVGPDVHRQEVPTPKTAVRSNGTEHRRSSRFIQFIPRMFHLKLLAPNPLQIQLQHACAKQIMRWIHGARLIAMKPGAITGESNEIPPRTFAIGQSFANCSHPSKSTTPGDRRIPRQRLALRHCRRSLRHIHTEARPQGSAPSPTDTADSS